MRVVAYHTAFQRAAHWCERGRQALCEWTHEGGPKGAEPSSCRRETPSVTKGARMMVREASGRFWSANLGGTAAGGFMWPSIDDGGNQTGMAGLFQ